MNAVTVRGNDPTHPPKRFHLLVASFALHERAGRLRERQASTEHHLQILQRPFKADIVEALVSVCTSFFRLGRSLCPNGAGAPTPDLKDYDRERHGCILFDNVNDMQFVLDHRALLQANTQTGMYAYRVWLHKVPIVMTVDDSAQWNSTERGLGKTCRLQRGKLNDM